MTFSTRSIAGVDHLRPLPVDRSPPWWSRIGSWASTNLGRFAPLGGLPPIVIGSTEHHELNVLAMASPHHDAGVSDSLFYELDRAEVVPDDKVGNDIIRMGSTILYRSATGRLHRVSIVYPGEADTGAGKISVLSPVGAALIGLRKGQSIAQRTADGRLTALTVISVLQPSPGPATQPAGLAYA